MTSVLVVRPIRRSDYAQWRPLWDGYNAFYGRAGFIALAEDITKCTWERFFNPVEPVFALLCEVQGRVAGLAHYLFHRSTTKVEPVCYLQDIFTEPEFRGKGVGGVLIKAVYEQARLGGAKRVYWQTQATSHAARGLYDKLAQHSGFIIYSHETQ